jgi:undecaprenyl pyrophosphate phosphatase UppP
MLASVGEIRRQEKRQWQFILVITLFTVIVSIVGLFVGATSPLPENSVTFVVFFTVYNMYIWALAIAYTPAKESDDFNRQPGVGNGDVELERLSAV